MPNITQQRLPVFLLLVSNLQCESPGDELHLLYQAHTAPGHLTPLLSGIQNISKGPQHPFMLAAVGIGPKQTDRGREDKQQAEQTYDPVVGHRHGRGPRVKEASCSVRCHSHSNTEQSEKRQTS